MTTGGEGGMAATNGGVLWKGLGKAGAIHERVPCLACAGHVTAGVWQRSWNRSRIVPEIVALDVPFFQGSCSEAYLEKSL